MLWNETIPAVLTSRERREDVAYLCQSYLDEYPDGYPVAHVTLATDTPEEQLYRLMCYATLAAQPAPDVLIRNDWQAFEMMGIPGAILGGTFDLQRYALDCPVSRADSRGKVIDWVRLAATRSTWTRLLPEPCDPDVTVDVLFAVSGGALKVGAFWVVREMRRLNLWSDETLDRSAYHPTGRTRKRAARMGLVDLPESASTFADLKAFSRALRAVTRLGDAPEGSYTFPVEAGPRCELCDAARMASCPIPHCRWRRQHAC